MGEEEESIYTQDGTVNYRGDPAVRTQTGTWKACPYILGNLITNLMFMCLKKLTDS